MQDRPSRISRVVAVRNLGRALLGEDWIGELTGHERWLIKRYGPGRTLVVQSEPSILPGRVSYVANLGRDLEPKSQELMAEVERARDRHHWKEAQYRDVLDWLNRNGFDPAADDFGRDGFEQAFQRAFGELLLTPQSTAQPIVALPQETAKKRAVKNYNEKSLSEAIIEAVSFIEKEKREGRPEPKQSDFIALAKTKGLTGHKGLWAEAFNRAAEKSGVDVRTGPKHAVRTKQKMT
jgi:hypothetical protein